MSNEKNNMDLRQLLLMLYLKNNPKLEHQIFIYSFLGVSDAQTNPFHYVNAVLPPHIKKSIILQNVASGEMIQAFISAVKNNEGRSEFQIENIVLYGNKVGILIEISLQSEKIGQTEKYRQFSQLASSLMRQFM
ncbi:MAG: hypothetical protein Q4B82_06660 [Alysiella sp.]|uniref:hypothetical protein n=1 Tax=Alysiella sp. TaxID=1872483 RepID=UPI0026DC256F|nr:hypothetical protein [Alysiella sp.]MDO4434244.1 hypothetical protein [Alysiella sp.]